MFCCSWTLLTNCTTVNRTSNACFTAGLQGAQSCLPAGAGSTISAGRLIATNAFGGDGEEGAMCTLDSQASPCKGRLTCTTMPVSI